MDFDMLGLPPRLLTNIAAAGLTRPTPIQRQAIPHALNGRDVMGLAQTGSGKTAAFGLPILATLLDTREGPSPKGASGLILAPTRELATQIVEALRSFADRTSIRITLVVGGKSINPQIQKLARGTDLLVATPGRLIDLLDRRALRLDGTRFLVLDEADQMLDLGFIHALRKIAALLPEARQTMLFSATMPGQMAEIAARYLTDPVRVEVNPPGKPVEKIAQSVHFVAQTEKLALLRSHLAEHPEEAALVFARTKHGAERIKRKLEAEGLQAGSVHGNKSQGQRDRALSGFRDGTIKVLVATDVAARGLDIPLVRVVYNYDLPNVPDSYVHRIGRTARAGRDGTAIAYCAPDEMEALRAIEKVMARRIEIAGGTPWEPDPAKRQPARAAAGRPAGARSGAKKGRARRRRPRKAA